MTYFFDIVDAPYLYVNTFVIKDVKIRHAIWYGICMTQDNWYRMTLRMPPELAEQLRKEANNSGHSLTLEIIKRLSESRNSETLRHDDFDLDPKELAHKINLLAKRFTVIAEEKRLPKKELLTKEESNLLKWFNKANKNEQELLMNSLPELLSLLKKLS